MLKKEVIIDFKGILVFEKNVSKVGNGAHILVTKNLIGKKVRILIGDCKISNKKLNFNFLNVEILERKASKFGTSAHVIIPKEYAGKKIKLIVEVKNE